mmetsp:Transcript_21721/g.65283  ORF Transcript_21721/g.65283 Transcript_21721/m.65283 type:complete len:420 (-) Transcript_21721:684-1943(-)
MHHSCAWMAISLVAKMVSSTEPLRWSAVTTDGNRASSPKGSGVPGPEQRCRWPGKSRTSVGRRSPSTARSSWLDAGRGTSTRRKASSMSATYTRTTGKPWPCSTATWSSNDCSPGVKNSRESSSQRDRLHASKYEPFSFSWRWARRISFASRWPTSLWEPCCLITARRTPARRSMPCTRTETERSWLRMSLTMTSVSGSSHRSAGKVAQSSARLGPTRTVLANAGDPRTACALTSSWLCGQLVGPSTPGSSTCARNSCISATTSLPSFSCRQGGQELCKCTSVGDPPHCICPCSRSCTSTTGSPTLRVSWKSPAVECMVTFCSRCSDLPMYRDMPCVWGKRFMYDSRSRSAMSRPSTSSIGTFRFAYVFEVAFGWSVWQQMPHSSTCRATCLCPPKTVPLLRLRRALKKQKSSPMFLSG